jgi:hypothetical protein
VASWTATGVFASRSSRRCTLGVTRVETTPSPGGIWPARLEEVFPLEVGQAQRAGQRLHDLRGRRGRPPFRAGQVVDRDAGQRGEHSGVIRSSSPGPPRPVQAHRSRRPAPRSPTPSSRSSTTPTSCSGELRGDQRRGVRARIHAGNRSAPPVRRRDAAHGARTATAARNRVPGRVRVRAPPIVLDDRWAHLRDGAFVVREKERDVRPIAQHPGRKRRLWDATAELLRATTPAS